MTRVHWLLLTQADLPSGEGWLAPAERARLAGLRVPKRRAEWLLGRWTAKQAVLAHLPGNAAAADVEIRAAPDGAPEVLLGGRPAPLAVSLSHRAGLALCTVAPAGTALGCDLELVEPHSDAFVADYLTAAERALVERAGPAGRDLVVALVWSAKESALKALRTGLRRDTRDVAVQFGRPPAGEVRPEGSSARRGPGDPGGVAWWIRTRGDAAVDGDQEGRRGGLVPAGHWWPLAVRHPAGGRVLAGWWRQDADLVSTVIAVPAPDRPERLGVDARPPRREPGDADASGHSSSPGAGRP